MVGDFFRRHQILFFLLSDEAAEELAEQARQIVHDEEEGGYDEQRKHRRDDDAADDGDRHGSTEGAAFADPHGGWQHAGRHGDRGHDDRPCALAAGLDHCVNPLQPVPFHLDGEIDEQDGVLRDDAHQHQDADEDGHGERILCRDQRHCHAADGERQGE
ncbi:hypothetical protein D3C87_1475290 [compost metagenome]